MATLGEYFGTDFVGYVSLARTLRVGAPDDSTSLKITACVHHDFNSHTKFLAFYIQPCPDLFQVCVALLDNLELALSVRGSVVVRFPHASQFFGGLQVGNSPATIHATPLGESPIDYSAITFSQTVFIYSEEALSITDLADIKGEAQKRNILLRFRGPDYARERAKLEKPLAFISHDSRDKDQIARPLALELSKLRCPVWYDEYSLGVGDRLRESIERGLKECRKCVLLLSDNFLSNNGWTKVEFNAIFTREIAEGKDFVLPVWCGVTSKQLFDYSPSLIDRYGINWNLGVEEVARKLHKAIL
jgi:hypothetical protein